jgi:spermidine synthase
VSARLEELDFQSTPMGELTLRRRHEPTLDVDVYEVKLGDEYLMSSLFTVAEEELARRGLGVVDRDELDVMVGGLGLGYTAVTALHDSRVAKLTVVDVLAPVIDWHRRKLLPVSAELVDDPRTLLVEDDFFALMRAEPAADGSRYDAILVDIDHTPRHRLADSHGDLYSPAGLRAASRHLRPGGAFGLWSDDPPDDVFLADLASVFASSAARIVDFDNPLTGGISSNTVYVATT